MDFQSHSLDSAFTQPPKPGLNIFYHIYATYPDSLLFKLSYFITNYLLNRVYVNSSFIKFHHAYKLLYRFLGGFLKLENL